MAGRTIDTSLFPKLREGQSSREALEELYRYCFELTEKLSYLLANLGEDNFNKTALSRIKGEGRGLSVDSALDENGVRTVTLRVDGALKLSAPGGIYAGEIKIG